MKRKCIIGAHETMFSHMVACIIRSFDVEILIAEARNLDELFNELDEDSELVIVLEPHTFSFEMERVCKTIYASNPRSKIVCLCQEKCNKFFGLRLYRCEVNCIISNMNNPNELLRVIKNAFDGITYYPKEILDAVKMREHLMMPDYCSALTPRELELVGCLMKKMQGKCIATTLNVKENTVWAMTSRIIKKLGVATREEAVKLAIDAGIVGK